jgi:SAM-dependent methyltransferase
MTQHEHHDHDHLPRGVERHTDVAIVGGSAGALGVALDLVRADRSVMVVDPADTPATTDAAVREAVRSRGGEVLTGRVVQVDVTDAGGRLALTGGHTIVARLVLDATDSLTDLTNAAARILAVLAEHDAGHRDARSANEVDWDHRYGGPPVWSGNPNGTLVHEVSDLSAGRALDVGAGEGGDAIWLADRGWQVTATDVSSRALARIEAEAARRGVTIDCRHVDANAPGAFGAATYDLVSAQYASIPRTPDDRAVRQVLDAVAPGGIALVVSHDLAPMRTPLDTTTASRMFDPDAYVRVDDFVRVIDDSREWTIEAHETRSRPPGAVSHHHVDDIVLRARRRG